MRKKSSWEREVQLKTFVAVFVILSATRFNVPQFVARYKGASENAEAMKEHGGGSDSKDSASKRPQSSTTATNRKTKKTKSSK